MVANPQPKRKYNDEGKRLRFQGKSIEARGGARVFSDAPVIYDHFETYKPTTYTAATANGPFVKGLTYTSTGTALVNPTILAVGASNVTGGAGGVLRLSTDDIQNTAEEIAGPLFASVDTHGPLVFEARLKVTGGASSTEATRESFFGLGDALTYTNGQPYTVTTASAITGTNVPADFGGFAISGVPTSGAGFNTDIDGAGTDGQNVGFITSVGAVDVYSALTPDRAGVTGGGRFVANAAGTTGSINNVGVFHTYRIEVDIIGVPRFFVDNMYCGKGSALTITVPFGVYFTVISKTASGANTDARMDLDYYFLACNQVGKG